MYFKFRITFFLSLSFNLLKCSKIVLETNVDSCVWIKQNLKTLIISTVSSLNFKHIVVWISKFWSSGFDWFWCKLYIEDLLITVCRKSVSCGKCSRSTASYVTFGINKCLGIGEGVTYSSRYLTANSCTISYKQIYFSNMKINCILFVVWAITCCADLGCFCTDDLDL